MSELLLTIVTVSGWFGFGFLLCRSMRNGYCPTGSGQAVTKQDLEKMEKRLMSALSDEIAGVKAKVVEGTQELTAKIAALEAALGSDNLSAESRAALDELKAAANTLADIVPNPTPEPTPAPE